MNGPKLTDERLCWLAVRDELRRKARGRGVVALMRILAASPGRGRRLRSDDANELVADRMRHYAFAVDELAERLDPQERQVLRQTGRVPAWFLGQVEQRAAEIRKVR